MQSCKCVSSSPGACTCSVHWERRKGRMAGMNSSLCRRGGSDTHPRPEWERGTGLRGSSLRHLPGLAHQYNSSLTSTT